MRVEVMSTRKILETLMKEKAPGPTPSFQIFHIIKALELISHAPVGRGMLAKKLGIGEGATRTLIERLKNEQIISISKSGCTLTKKGEQLWKRIEKIIPSKIELEQSKLTLSACNVAILVQGKANKVKLGMEQRDAAFLAGAKGATTLVMKKGKLQPAFLAIHIWSHLLIEQMDKDKDLIVDGTPRKLMDGSKLKALGWRPRIGLEEGIRSTYDWFLARHGVLSPRP